MLHSFVSLPLFNSMQLILLRIPLGMNYRKNENNFNIDVQNFNSWTHGLFLFLRNDSQPKTNIAGLTLHSRAVRVRIRFRHGHEPAKSQTLTGLRFVVYGSISVLTTQFKR